ncbi:MAG: hypothetical protein BWX69_03147 [Planctomycetes bacterium ADurb.Bin069]|nr:MAG: hypothetical protein BWX69_03147 [Planctomycetes bacterium ADurb.Bin069]
MPHSRIRPATYQHQVRAVRPPRRAAPGPRIHAGWWMAALAAGGGLWALILRAIFA